MFQPKGLRALRELRSSDLPTSDSNISSAYEEVSGAYEIVSGSSGSWDSISTSVVEQPEYKIHGSRPPLKLGYKSMKPTSTNNNSRPATSYSGRILTSNNARRPGTSAAGLFSPKSLQKASWEEILTKRLEQETNTSSSLNVKVKKNSSGSLISTSNFIGRAELVANEDDILFFDDTNNSNLLSTAASEEVQEEVVYESDDDSSEGSCEDPFASLHDSGVRWAVQTTEAEATRNANNKLGEDLEWEPDLWIEGVPCAVRSLVSEEVLVENNNNNNCPDLKFNSSSSPAEEVEEEGESAALKSAVLELLDSDRPDQTRIEEMLTSLENNQGASSSSSIGSYCQENYGVLMDRMDQALETLADFKKERAREETNRQELISFSLEVSDLDSNLDKEVSDLIRQVESPVVRGLSVLPKLKSSSTDVACSESSVLEQAERDLEKACSSSSESLTLANNNIKESTSTPHLLTDFDHPISTTTDNIFRLSGDAESLLPEDFFERDRAKLKKLNSFLDEIERELDASY